LKAVEQGKPPGAAQEGFFDEALLGELENLVSSVAGPTESGATLPEKLALFRAPRSAGAPPLDEQAFLELQALELTERLNLLTSIARQSSMKEAVQAVEGFIVFFRALLPTLSEAGAGAVKRVFFRFVPALIQIAFHDFAGGRAERAEGREALLNLERVLLEISSVRLAPVESELVFRSIDHLVDFIGVAEYAMANELISSQLLGLIARNRLTRALYHLMNVEVEVQRHLSEKLGAGTPRLRLPEDAARLADYGPLRIFDEKGGDERTRRFIQVHLPNIEILKDIVLHLVDEQTQVDSALRLDRLGAAELNVPAGVYRLGLAYEPL
jgi:hypothetical protein